MRAGGANVGPPTSKMGDMISYAFDTKYADFQQKLYMESNNKGKFQKYLVYFFADRHFPIKIGILKTLNIQARFIWLKFSSPNIRNKIPILRLRFTNGIS